MKQLYIAVLLLYSAIGFSQITVTGTIKNAVTNEPIPFANVVETKTANGTTADGYGYFSIEALKNKAVLECTAIGFNSQNIFLGPCPSPHLNLPPKCCPPDSLFLVLLTKTRTVLLR